MHHQWSETPISSLKAVFGCTRQERFIDDSMCTVQEQAGKMLGGM
jgi:hypothetical protein